MVTDPNIGRMLSNRYRLLELIGKGAMGRVYRAEDTNLGNVLAVKFLAQTLLNSKMRDRFRIEARTCAHLSQKSIHIVRVTDFGVNEDDIPFYVMEYLQGESLSDVIKPQPLALPRFLSLTRQICLGLQCAHQGIMEEGRLCPIIHRDIKPSNILVSQDSSLGELVKILDFGISKLLQADSSQTSSYMGTLAYSSPEQMEGRELDDRSDIYSLGIMMFEMLTGKMPLYAETHTFSGWYSAHHYQPPRTFDVVAPGLRLPKALETLVMSCLNKSPANRPQSVAEILKALEPLEQRYSGGRQISQRIGEVLSRNLVAIEAPPPPSLPKFAETDRQILWPKSKPIAQIVFPQALATKKETTAAVWAMFPQEEVDNLRMYQLYNKVYKNFLCTMSPHPMLLWFTAIYNRHSGKQGPRWLRCYLDLKSVQGEEIVRLLSEKSKYNVLLFELENPEHPPHIISIPLPQPQCTLLKQWLISSGTQVSVGEPSLSKNLLQIELEKIKPKVAADLENASDLSFNIAGLE